MTRKEFIEFADKQELKEVFEAFIEGKEKSLPYTRDGEVKRWNVTKNGFLNFKLSNYYLSLQRAESGKYYLSICYNTCDDRIKKAKLKNDA